MKLFRRDEIFNRHNIPIYYWSKQPGNTELEKFRNFKVVMGDVNDIEYTIADNQGNDITCIVDVVEGPEGYILTCFNNTGETILNIEDCYSNDRTGVIEALRDNNIL